MPSKSPKADKKPKLIELQLSTQEGSALTTVNLTEHGSYSPTVSALVTELQDTTENSLDACLIQNQLRLREAKKIAAQLSELNHLRRYRESLASEIAKQQGEIANILESYSEIKKTVDCLAAELAAVHNPSQSLYCRPQEAISTEMETIVPKLQTLSGLVLEKRLQIEQLSQSVEDCDLKIKRRQEITASLNIEEQLTLVKQLQDHQAALEQSAEMRSRQFSDESSDGHYRKLVADNRSPLSEKVEKTTTSQAEQPSSVNAETNLSPKPDRSQIKRL